jgi:hypothetical protein
MAEALKPLQAGDEVIFRLTGDPGNDEYVLMAGQILAAKDRGVFITALFDGKTSVALVGLVGNADRVIAGESAYLVPAERLTGDVRKQMGAHATMRTKLVELEQTNFNSNWANVVGNIAKWEAAHCSGAEKLGTFEESSTKDQEKVG